MIENIIIGNLLVNPSFRKRTVKHLVPSHFAENERLVEIIQYLTKSFPGEISAAQVGAEIDTLLVKKQISNDERQRLKIVASEMYKSEIVDENWLFKSAETFTRDKSLYHAILDSITIYENKDSKSKKSIHDIPGMVSKALDISFSPKVGIDFANAEDRWEKYNKPEVKIPFRLRTLNLITNKGATRGSLNIVNAPINAGKSMSLFALAADYMSSGFNVAVFTMEMPELEVMKRIDANLLRVPINDVPRIDKPKFIDEIEAVSERSRGRLKVREYYTGEGNVTLFKQQMEDWFGFDGFKPDVILVDYLGICTSAIPGMLSSGSYAHLKQISVELRALAQWSNTVLWTAMQLNRDGIRSGGSGGMADMSESIGVPMTADFILLLHRSPDLDAIGKVTFHQIKTRYADKTIAPTVTLKLDLACQRFDDDDDFVANLELQKAVTRSVKYNTKHEDELLEADTMAFMAEHFVKQQSATDDDIKV
jgi:replicative DNA helicase